jgi:hypothetical protein
MLPPACATRRRWLVTCLAGLLASVLVNCQSKSGERLQGQTLSAACAMCIFKMEGVRGCIWAVEIKEKYYLADGNLPKHHDAHGPDGMCNVGREAVVDGELVNNKFIATRFDLKPAAHIPENPRFTPADKH